MSGPTNASGDTGMQELIPVVNKLQDIIFSSTSCGSIDLPQVVVVGAQSSGKSSVIELLVRRDFLPRGTGIVTRRPLAISLINDREEYCEFLHLSGRRFTDFDEVRQEIENETFRLAGNNKGISSTPISLKIHSPHVLDLTVVDLPGVTKVPIGEQPADIEKQTKELVLKYITNPNSIILAVTPANQDLVNSESLKLARSVDPNGKRTLGVLTKLDLMDRGTNALDVLNGVTYPLNLGFIGIVNRSQQDIQDKKSLEESLEAEREFFASHPAYRSISHKCGTSYLSRSLNHILMNHIRERLPDMKARLNTLIGQTEQELASFGQGQIPDGKDQQGGLILTMMMKYAQAFTGSIDGSTSTLESGGGFEELGGGARIYQIFSDVFEQSMRKIDPLDHISYAHIRNAIRNSSGPRCSLFVPEAAFDMLVKPLIKLLEQPSQRCVEMVFEELMKICHTCGGVEFDRFPKLLSHIIDTLSKLLNENLGPTSHYVSSLIDIQRAYIKTDHEKFISTREAMEAVYERRLASAHNANSAHTPQRQHTPTPDTDLENSGSEEEPASAQGSAIARQEPAQKEMFMRYFLGKHPVKHNGLGPLRANAEHPNQPPTSAQTQSQPQTSASAFNTDIDGDLSAEERAMKQLRIERMESEAASLTEEERTQCDLMYQLIKSYFSITRETICDQVPKAIMHFLVNNTKSSVQNRLVSKLYKEELFPELLYEDQALVQERAKLTETLETYRSAAKVISEVL